MGGLFPIDQIIKTARASGVDFGSTDPHARLAYLTKIRLLPQTIRKKVGQKIAGFYPAFVADRLTQIENLKNAGLTYPQIRYELDHPVNYSNSVPTNYHNGLAFLFIGLILGYLLSTKTSPPPAAAAPAAAFDTANLETKSPLYLIAVPGNLHNLEKLGKTDLSVLLKSP